MQAGAEVACNVKVVEVDQCGGGLMVKGQDVATQDVAHVLSGTVVNCGGLHAHEVARCVRGLPQQHVPRVWFAKGNYFTIPGYSPFSRLIYPMPDDGGLGTHLTLDLAGECIAFNLVALHQYCALWWCFWQRGAQHPNGLTGSCHSFCIARFQMYLCTVDYF